MPRIELSILQNLAHGTPRCCRSSARIAYRSFLVDCAGDYHIRLPWAGCASGTKNCSCRRTTSANRPAQLVPYTRCAALAPRRHSSSARTTLSLTATRSQCLVRPLWRVGSVCRQWQRPTVFRAPELPGGCKRLPTTTVHHVIRRRWTKDTGLYSPGSLSACLAVAPPFQHNPRRPGPVDSCINEHAVPWGEGGECELSDPSVKLNGAGSVCRSRRRSPLRSSSPASQFRARCMNDVGVCWPPGATRWQPVRIAAYPPQVWVGARCRRVS